MPMPRKPPLVPLYAIDGWRGRVYRHGVHVPRTTVVWLDGECPVLVERFVSDDVDDDGNPMVEILPGPLELRVFRQYRYGDPDALDT